MHFPGQKYRCKVMQGCSGKISNKIKNHKPDRHFPPFPVSPPLTGLSAAGIPQYLNIQPGYLEDLVEDIASNNTHVTHSKAKSKKRSPTTAVIPSLVATVPATKISPKPATPTTQSSTSPAAPPSSSKSTSTSLPDTKPSTPASPSLPNPSLQSQQSPPLAIPTQNSKATSTPLSLPTPAPEKAQTSAAPSSPGPLKSSSSKATSPTAKPQPGPTHAGALLAEAQATLAQAQARLAQAQARALAASRPPTEQATNASLPSSSQSSAPKSIPSPPSTATPAQKTSAPSPAAAAAAAPGPKQSQPTLPNTITSSSKSGQESGTSITGEIPSSSSSSSDGKRNGSSSNSGGSGVQSTSSGDGSAAAVGTIKNSSSTPGAAASPATVKALTSIVKGLSSSGSGSALTIYTPANVALMPASHPQAGLKVLFKSFWTVLRKARKDSGGSKVGSSNTVLLSEALFDPAHEVRGTGGHGWG